MSSFTFYLTYFYHHMKTKFFFVEGKRSRVWDVRSVNYMTIIADDNAFLLWESSLCFLVLLSLKMITWIRTWKHKHWVTEKERMRIKVDRNHKGILCVWWMNYRGQENLSLVWHFLLWWCAAIPSDIHTEHSLRLYLQKEWKKCWLFTTTTTRRGLWEA